RRSSLRRTDAPIPCAVPPGGFFTSIEPVLAFGSYFVYDHAIDGSVNNLFYFGQPPRDRHDKHQGANGMGGAICSDARSDSSPPSQGHRGEPLEIRRTPVRAAALQAVR